MATGTDQALSFAWPRYALDKVIHKPLPSTVSVTQSASPIAPTFTSVTFNNPVGRFFIVDLQVSTDGNVWYDSGLEPIYYDAGFMLPFKRFISLWSMTDKIVTLKFAALDASYSLRYRLVGVSLE